MRVSTLALASLVAGASFAQAAEGVFESVPLKPKDAELIQQSNEIGDLFRRKGYLAPEGPETELVRSIGMAVSPRPPIDSYMRFRFGVVQDPIPNAFALPDGQIYVHAGLLALLENEAQLAGVLAHESCHVEGHHSILNARQARKKVGGMLALSIVLGQIGSLVNIALEAAIIGYGRDLEREADLHAIPRVLEAGFDPREMPRVFELLEQDPEGDRIQVSAAWSDHPLGQARLAYTREILAGMTDEIAAAERANGPLRTGTENFGRLVAWAAHDSVKLYIEADRARSALVLAKKSAARFPHDAESQFLLGESWRALDARVAELPEQDVTKKAKRSRLSEYERMTREERAAIRRANPQLTNVLDDNARHAEAAYRAALDLCPGHAGSLRGLGYLLEDREQLAAAGRAFADYLKVKPDAHDKVVILKHLASITEALEEGRP